MNQGVKIFANPPADVKNAAREVFDLKECSLDMVGDTAYAKTPDGKRSYKMMFLEHAQGTEVRLTIEVKKGFMGALKKGQPMSAEEEMKSVWKMMELTTSRDDGPAEKVMEDIRKQFHDGKGEVDIPEGVEVKLEPGGILTVTDTSVGRKREIIVPGGVILEIDGQTLRVA